MLFQFHLLLLIKLVRWHCCLAWSCSAVVSESASAGRTSSSMSSLYNAWVNHESEREQHEDQKITTRESLCVQQPYEAMVAACESDF